jgi:hypothetical protein
MSSKDFLVTEPGLTYLYTSQRLTPLDVPKMQQEFGEDAFTVAPYTQKLQRTLKLKHKDQMLRLKAFQKQRY